MLVVTALAAGLRFYHLGQWPPGLYRDEAYNGLDALGVLGGNHPLFFPANNGREPLFIYLVALAVAAFGPTVYAVRLPAAVVGTLAAWPTYLLGRDWFGRVAGLLAACLWAITFWPVHLGRIGLRVGLLAPLLALAFWLGTRAYRRQRAALWLAAGAVYGLTFYTYLAARFTPLILVLFAVYLVITGRRARLWDGGRMLWFAAGAAVVAAPLGILMLGDPALIFGRAGQVSIFSPAISGGDPAGALVGNVGRALGMYLWRGDDILRHNTWLDFEAAVPAGRPVFDWLMAGPFLAGLAWCLRHWRRPAAALLLLWQLVMLGPTILAEDAPHFLRAAGVLPGAVFFPAIGLALLWDWTRLPTAVRRAAVVLLLGGSAALTVRDYADYAQQPDVGYLFESAATELAHHATEDANAGSAVYLDQRFPDGWPSVRFLLPDGDVTLLSPEDGWPFLDGKSVVYAWPYEPLDVAGLVTPPAWVEVAPGPPARGDLEPEAYSLYSRYAIAPRTAAATPIGNFDGLVALMSDTTADLTALDTMSIDLRWEALSTPWPTIPPTVFIHVIGPEGMLAQYDGPLGRGLWPAAGWQPGIIVGERHILSMNRPYDSDTDSVQVGLYWPDTGTRLPVLDARGDPVDDKIILQPTP